jgi:hypothetical protein
MKYYNIFDKFVNNEDVSEMALCATYDLLKKLIGEFEKSAFFRVKCSFEELHEMDCGMDDDSSCDDPPF